MTSYSAELTLARQLPIQLSIAQISRCQCSAGRGHQVGTKSRSYGMHGAGDADHGVLVTPHLRLCLLNRSCQGRLHASTCPSEGQQHDVNITAQLLASSSAVQPAWIRVRVRAGRASVMPAACHCAASMPGGADLWQRSHSVGASRPASISGMMLAQGVSVAHDLDLAAACSNKHRWHPPGCAACNGHGREGHQLWPGAPQRGRDGAVVLVTRAGQQQRQPVPLLLGTPQGLPSAYPSWL